MEVKADMAPCFTLIPGCLIDILSDLFRPGFVLTNEETIPH